MKTYFVLVENLPTGYYGMNPYAIARLTTDMPIPKDNSSVSDEFLKGLSRAVFHLEEDSVLTEILSQPILPPPGLLVSPGLAGILQEYHLPPECSFYPTTVQHGEEQYDAYWMHIKGFQTNLIDFEQTKFARFRPTHKELQSMMFRTLVSRSTPAIEGRVVAVHNEQELMEHVEEFKLVRAAINEAELEEEGFYEEDFDEEDFEEDENENFDGEEENTEDTDEEPLPEEVAPKWDDLSAEEQRKLEEELTAMALSPMPLTDADEDTDENTHEDESSSDTIDPEGERWIDAVDRVLYMKEWVDYDILAFPFPDAVLFVSERLAKAITSLPDTDAAFLPHTYQIYS